MKDRNAMGHTQVGAMVAVIGGDDRLIAPAECDAVVRRDDYVAYVEASGVIAEARSYAREIAIQAADDARSERERGYREGLAAGRAEMFAAIMDYQQDLRASINERVEELIALVAACAEKAIGTVLPRDFIGEMVAGAVRTFGDAQRVEVYGHPASVRELERMLAGAEPQGKSGANVRLIAESQMAEEEFRLVAGKVSISYSRSQLSALVAAALRPDQALGQTEQSGQASDD